MTILIIAVGLLNIIMAYYVWTDDQRHHKNFEDLQDIKDQIIRFISKTDAYASTSNALASGLGTTGNLIQKLEARCKALEERVDARWKTTLSEVVAVQEHCAKLREEVITLHDKTDKKRRLFKIDGPVQLEIGYTPTTKLGKRKKA